MTFQALQATTLTQSSTSDDYVPTGTDTAEYESWIKTNNNELGDIDDLSDDFADAGFVPRDNN